MNIIESNGRFTLADFTAKHNELPAGNYLLKFDPREGYYLTNKADFILPKKIYGDHSAVERWLKSYEVNSEKNMGIILSGLKGSGKTITAQKFCIESKMPVIIINESFHGSDFIDFITSFSNTVIFIDEFEKIYQKQEYATDLLSMMDGNYQTKLVFLLTVNEFTINPYLINRLNRIKYRKTYKDLEADVMEDVIEDLLVNKDHRESIYKFFEKVNMCTFDLLVNIIKEMNLFKEDALVCGTHLNLESESKTYDVYEVIDGTERMQSTIIMKGDVTEFQYNRNFIPKSSRRDDDDNSWSEYIVFDKSVITNTGKDNFILENPEKTYRLKFIKREPTFLVF